LSFGIDFYLGRWHHHVYVALFWRDTRWIFDWQHG
jgi:hypothetical protein